jgi:hypothetical protein
MLDLNRVLDSTSKRSGMMKLNGWKRIGIIASLVWIVGAGVHTYDSEIDRASQFIADTHMRCDSNLPDHRKDENAYEAAFHRCNKEPTILLR